MPKPTYRFVPRFPFFVKTYNTGLVNDPRSDAEKASDFAHEERLMSTTAVPADPFGNAKIVQSPFFLENQWYVGSCVPHGVGLALCIERNFDYGEYVRLAQLFPYRLRYNYPQAGCWMQDIYDVYKKNGAPLYATLPTKVGMTEADATALVITDNMRNEGLIYAGLEYWTLNTGFNDIVQLATIAKANHGVSIIFYATYDEWSKTYPTIDNPKLDPNTAEVRHCVTVLPNSGFIENGVKYVAIQDSAWFAGLQLRYLSEAFIKARVYGAAYWDKVSQLGGGAYPKHTFTKSLSVGMSGPEVVALQLLLIAEHMLPSDCATGYFGGRTLAGLHAFQTKYAADILLPQGLSTPTDLFGPGSIKKANTLCK